MVIGNHMRKQNVKSSIFLKAYTMESKTVFLIITKSMSVQLIQKPDIISIKLVLSFHFLYLEEYSDNSMGNKCHYKHKKCNIG